MRRLWRRFRKNHTLDLRVNSIEEEMKDLANQGYLLRKGTDESTGEPLYSLNYMKHSDATPEDEKDVVMLKMKDGSVEKGLRMFLKEGWEEA